MGIAQGLFKFIVGGAAGTAVGLAIGSILAPQKGSDFQEAAHQRIADAKAAGDEAARLTELEMQAKFRQATGNPNAFSPTDGLPKGV